MTEQEAIAYVTLFAQTEIFPCVDETTVTDLVRKNVRAVVWEPETAYKVGDVVQPSTPNGHFYKCVKAGTSGSDAPIWFEPICVRVWDGSGSLVWEECAIDVDGNLFDTRRAVYEAWILKASQATKEFDVKLDTESFNRSQVYKMCMEMAEKYSPFNF